MYGFNVADTFVADALWGSAGSSRRPDKDTLGESGGERALPMLPWLLFGRGGGGRLVPATSESLELLVQAFTIPGEVGASNDPRVFSSNSSAASRSSIPH